MGWGVGWGGAGGRFSRLGHLENKGYVEGHERLLNHESQHEAESEGVTPGKFLKNVDIIWHNLAHFGSIQWL